MVVIVKKYDRLGVLSEGGLSSIKFQTRHTYNIGIFWRLSYLAMDFHFGT